MMSTKIYILIVTIYVVETALASGQILSNEELYSHGEWQSLVDRVYNSKRSPLEPIKLIELLNQANKIYEKLREKRPMCKEDRKIASQMWDLLSLTKIVGTDCTIGHFEKLKRTIQLHRDEQSGLLPYFVYFSHEHFDECKRQFTSKLRNVVDSYEQVKRQHAELIMNKLIASDKYVLNDHYASISDDNISKAIADYYLSRPSLSNRTVASVCEGVGAHLDELCKNYDGISGNKEAAQELDDFTKEWLSIKSVCSKILGNYRFYIRMTYRQLSAGSS